MRAERPDNRVPRAAVAPPADSDAACDRAQVPTDRPAPNAAVFGSILFPSGLEGPRPDGQGTPDCFIDLNLDQVVSAIVASRDEEVLRPIFYSPYRNEKIVRYRQSVFDDLERPDVLRIFPAFSEEMQSVRADLAYAAKITAKRHEHMVFLRAVKTYCSAVRRLLQDLDAVELLSEGLKSFRRFLRDHAASPAFETISAETDDLSRALSGLSYGMLFRGDKVTVRKYEGEPDYTVTVRERFAKFREAEVDPPALKKRKTDTGLNHIEEGILEFVGRLFPAEFRGLADYVGRRGDFIDETIARFDREIGFFIAYLAFIDPLRRSGLPFCRPEVSVSSKETELEGSFDLALAMKLSREGGRIVRNDARLSGSERLIVVTGPNQGGKTTFARMFGQVHFLAGLGCPVPGQAARLFLPDRVFTHFEREEEIANLRGKLEDELVRLHESCEAMTDDSLIVLNEIFNSTSLDDQIFLSTAILERILASDAIGVCVTFIDPLSRLNEKTVSMVSTVDPEDLARRTFEIVRRPADGLAYALSLAEKHGVTYERLRTRVRP